MSKKISTTNLVVVALIAAFAVAATMLFIPIRDAIMAPQHQQELEAKIYALNPDTVGMSELLAIVSGPYLESQSSNNLIVRVKAIEDQNKPECSVPVLRKHFLQHVERSTTPIKATILALRLAENLPAFAGPASSALLKVVSPSLPGLGADLLEKGALEVGGHQMVDILQLTLLECI